MKSVLWAGVWAWVLWCVAELFQLAIDPFLLAAMATTVTWPEERQAFGFVCCAGWWCEAVCVLPVGTALSAYLLAFALVRYARAHFVWHGGWSWPWLVMALAAALGVQAVVAYRDPQVLLQRDLWWSLGVHGAVLLLIIPLWPRLCGLRLPSMRPALRYGRFPAG